MAMSPNATGSTRETRSTPSQRLHPRLDGRPALESDVGLVARGRVRWLRHCLDALGERPANMISLGWDHGSTTSEFFANLHIQTLTTIDVAPQRSLTRELRSADGKAAYIHVTDYRASESADLAFTHGIFEQLRPEDRLAGAVLVFRSLKPGGLFAVWQNNPWSPSGVLGARETPFGEPGPVITPRTVRRLLSGVGFDIVHTTSAIHFPDALAWCQPLLSPITIGKQYMVLARKP
jgi:hypothetical protein